MGRRAVRTGLRLASVAWISISMAATAAAVAGVGIDSVARVLTSEWYLGVAFWFLVPLGWLSLISLRRLRPGRPALLGVDVPWLGAALALMTLSVLAEAAAEAGPVDPAVYVASTTVPESLGIVSFFTFVVDLFETSGLAPRPGRRVSPLIHGVAAAAMAAPALLALIFAVRSGRISPWDGVAFGLAAAWLTHLLARAVSVPSEAQEAAGSAWVLALAALALQLSNLCSWFISEAASPSPVSGPMGVLSDAMDLISWTLIPLSVLSLVGFRVESAAAGVVELVEVPTTGPVPGGVWERALALSRGGRVIVVGRRWVPWIGALPPGRGAAIYLTATVDSPRELSPREFECPPDPETLAGLVSTLSGGSRSAVVVDDLSDLILLCGLDKVTSCAPTMRGLAEGGISFLLLLRRGSVGPGDLASLREAFGGRESKEIAEIRAVGDSN